MVSRASAKRSSALKLSAFFTAQADAALAIFEQSQVLAQYPDGLHRLLVKLRDRSDGPPVAPEEITAGCSGWVYALVTATQFIQSGTMSKILVIGTEIISYAVDYTDRATCVLFGDGSAAVDLVRRTAAGCRLECRVRPANINDSRGY